MSSQQVSTLTHSHADQGLIDSKQTRQESKATLIIMLSRTSNDDGGENYKGLKVRSKKKSLGFNKCIKEKKTWSNEISMS